MGMYIHARAQYANTCICNHVYVIGLQASNQYEALQSSIMSSTRTLCHLPTPAHLNATVINIATMNA